MNRKRQRGHKSTPESGHAGLKSLLILGVLLGTSIGTQIFLQSSVGGPATSVQVQTPSTNSENVAVLKMVQPRYGHTATTLPDGRILITGGLQTLDADNPQQATVNEVFDPLTGVFSVYGDGLPDPLGPAAAESNVISLSNGGALSFGLSGVSFSWDDIGSFIFTTTPTDGTDPVTTEIPVPGDTNLVTLQRAFATATALTQPSIYDSGNSQIHSYNRVLIAGGVMASGETADAAVFNPARLATDKDDYHPGEVVWLNGSGWKPGEEVNIWVVDSNGWQYKATLTADINGKFPYEQPLFNVLDEHLGVTFDLTAIGAESGLVSAVRFTDSTVTPASGGTGISADKAANAISPAYTTLGDITITEQASNDFPVQANTTLILTAPSGWQFNPGVGTTQVTKSGSGGNELNDNSIVVTATTITVNITVTGTGQINSLIIKGIQVRAAEGANIPSNGTIFRTAGNPGTATMTGIVNGTTSFGALSQVVGAMSKLVVTLPGQTFTDGSTVAASGISGTPTQQTAGAAFTITKITATDQFSNIVTTYAGVKTITYSGPGSNPGFPPLYTTSVNFSGGQSTTALTTTLTKAETTTITASEGTTSGPASSSVVVNPGAVASFRVTATDGGSIPNQTVGAPFNIMITAMDSVGNIATSFTGNGSKVMVTSTGNLSAGGGNTPGFSNGVLASYSVTFSNSGTFTITATGNGSNPPTGTSGNIVVNKATPTISGVSSKTITYGAATVALSGTVSAPNSIVPANGETVAVTINGVTQNAAISGGAGGFSLNFPTATIPTSGSPYTITYAYAGNATQLNAAANDTSATLTVNQKALTITADSDSNAGNGQNAFTKTYGSTLTFSGTEFTVGAGQLINGDTVTSVTLASTGAAATATVANYSVTIGSAVGTGLGNYTITYVPGTLNVTAKALTITADSDSNAGNGQNAFTKTYGSTLTFTGAEFTTSGLVNGDTVTSTTLASTGAAAAAIVASYSVTIGSAVGTGLGNYSITYVPGTLNVTKASSTTVTVGAGPFTYDGTTHAGGSGTVTGAGGLNTTATSVTYSANADGTGTADRVNAGTYYVTAHYAGDANHNSSDGSGVAIVINKATSTTVTVGAGPFTYDGTTHAGGSGTVTGAGGLNTTATSVTYSANADGTGAADRVNAGTYYVTAHYAGDANHQASNGLGVAIVINKAASTTLTVGAGPFTYDGTTHAGGSGTVTGAGGLSTSATSVTYSANADGTGTADRVNAGTYYVTAHYAGDANHNSSDGSGVAIVINKADATVTVNGYSGTYDGVAHGATGAATGVGGVDLSAGLDLGATFINVPGGAADWAFNGGVNYKDQSGSVAIVINKADAVVTVTPYDVTYDNMSHTATGAATGVEGEMLDGLDLSGTTHTDSGTFTDTWTFTDTTGNYNNDTGTVQDHIGKAKLSIAIINNPTKVYDANTSATLDSSNFEITGLQASESVTITQTAGTYNDANVASANTVTANLAPTDFEAGADTSLDNYELPTTASGAGHITKANPNVPVTGYSGVYDGNAHGATGSATGVLGEPLVGLNLGATFINVPGGTANWSFTDVTGNYKNKSGSASIVITKANATITVNGYSGVYDGNVHGATGSATGVKGESLTGLNLGSSFTNVPGGMANWTFTDVTGNYKDASGSVAIVISKADATISVNGYSGVYDGNAHGATGSAKGVKGETLASLDLGSSFTNVPGGTANWTFTDVTGNYNDAAGNVAIVISKADATITVNGYSGVYDGDPHGATGSATGVKGESLTGLGLGSSFTNVPGGTANWTFTDVTGNYNDDSGNVAIVITKADASITVTPYDVTYDNMSHTATGSATGVKGEMLAGLDLSGTTHTNAGTYTDTWTFTDPTGNYNSDTDMVEDHIAKAKLTVAIVNDPTKVYDGNTSATLKSSDMDPSNYEITGLLDGETITITQTVGTYNDANVATANLVTVTLAPTDFEPGADTSLDNYELPTTASGAGHITKANPTVSVTGYSGVYDGNAHGATGSATGVKGESLAGLNLGSSFTNVPGGTANWAFTDVTGNYNDASGSVAIVITKADATISVGGYNKPYDGNAHGATGSATGVKGEALAGLNLGAMFTNVPGGTAHWTFTDATGNYKYASDDVSIVITKANAIISITGYNNTYDGNAHGATGSATGVKGETLDGLDLGSSFTNVPGGTANWAFTDVTGNYNNSSGSVPIVITKANATISVSGYSGIYDGNAHGATGSAAGVKGEPLAGLNLGSSFTNVPGGTAHWMFTDATGNYKYTSGDVSIVITKANATITVNGYSGVYDGNAHGASGSAKGVKNEPLAGLNLGSSFTSVPGGTANWTFTDATGNYYNDSGSVAIVISKASSTTVTSGAGPFTYDTTTHAGGSGAVTGAGGLNTTATSVTYSANANGTGTADRVNAGTYYVTAHYAGDANHDPSDGSGVAIIINKVTPTATLAVNNSPKTYNTLPQAATVGVASSSVPGSVANVLTGGAATQTGAGTYAVTADFVPNDTANYKTLYGVLAGSFAIQKATPVITWANPADIVPGTPLGGTQLNATANVAGTFAYTPAAGAVLPPGQNQTLSVSFTPTDTANYTTATKTVSINVTYNFTGFFQPVDNLPVYNKAKAGSAIPVKFSLGGNFGLNILASGYPLAYEIVGGNVTSDIDEVVAAGNSSLNYDATANQYIFVWKTDKSWGGKSLQLVVKLSDGTEHRANFTLTK